MKSINTGALLGKRFRVIVSTDIGGSDPDDFQSMVHYLLYSDLFDTEGILSSAWGNGTKKDILDVIDKYEQDYPKLIQYSDNYPTPDKLRSITKQGEIDFAPWKGYRNHTEGSDWIIECCRKEDTRPIYFLGWGLLEDLAQALHDAPDIKDKLKVYFIGGPNKKWGLNAYEYVRTNFPDLWFIENNSTYRGWFVGGIQSSDLGNQSFVSEHILGHGALGDYFAKHLGGTIKMGDTPTVAYLLMGKPEQPEHESWGGSFCRISSRPKRIYNRNTTLQDSIEVFGVLELVFKGPVLHILEEQPIFYLVVENQEFEGFYCGNGEYKVRFMPKRTGRWSYITKSKMQELNGLTGEFTCVEESEEGRRAGTENLPNWWSDVLDIELAEQEHKGAKTVSMWRENFLKDFEKRMDRCR